MGEVIQLRDFQRREERDAALVRMAKEVMGQIPAPAWEPIGPNAIYHYADDKIYFCDPYDTAPSEMPPVQPYFAPTEDPA